MYLSSLLIKVIDIKGYCPVYQPNDEFEILDGYKLISAKEVCMHSLASFLPWYVALSKGVSPKELGLGDQEAAYIQCPDPCDYTAGGTVIFEIRRKIDE